MPLELPDMDIESVEKRMTADVRERLKIAADMPLRPALQDLVRIRARQVVHQYELRKEWLESLEENKAPS